MNREWIIDQYNGFESLRLREYEALEPGPTDVRLRIEAFALNWGDADLMRDNYSFSFSNLPARIGIEASGIAEAIGNEVEGVEIGQRYSTLQYFYDMRGMSADTGLIDQAYITRSPENLSAIESASVWMQFLTAYYPMVELAKAETGVSIFIPAGTSTAGNAAIQIAKQRGATVISSTRSQKNYQHLLDDGADHVFVDDGGDLEEYLRDVTGGVGVHTSFDPVGGDFMERYASALAKGGRLILYGGLSGTYSNPPFLSMVQNNLWFHAYSVFNYVEDQNARKRGVDFVFKGLSEGSLKPQIDRVFSMEEYIDAWRYLTGPRTSHGKVVVETRNRDAVTQAH